MLDFRLSREDGENKETESIVSQRKILQRYDMFQYLMK